MNRRDFLAHSIAGSVALAQTPDTSELAIARALQSSFIWCDASLAPPGKQVYAAFRKSFPLHAAPRQATLRIFADTRYLLWINGRYVERGPCRFDPKRPEYDTIDAAAHLRAGANTIAVLVHYYAIGSFQKWSEQCARMMEHAPGLSLRLDVDSHAPTSTGPGWRVTVNTGHLPSRGSYSSVPDDIDARLTADWTQPGFDDSGWSAAVPADGSRWGPLHPRSLPQLRETAVSHQTQLPIDLKPGAPVVLDLGRAYQVYSILDLEAAAGSELTVQHGMKEAAGFEQRLCRYVARQGRQTFMSTDTHGARYIEIRLKSGSARLLQARAIDRRYPYTRLGRFDSSDPVLNAIWQLGVQTIELCSEDAYVDCADRERAQWIADGYLTAYPVARVALAGPGSPYDYCDQRLLRNLLRHMAFSQLPDGRLQPMRPSNYPPDLKHGVIDDYTCLWVNAVRELHERSGDHAFTREVWPVMVKALDYFLKRRTARGLVDAQEFVYFNNPLAYRFCEGTSVNCYIYGALLDAVFLARQIGAPHNRFAQAAASLAAAINHRLWDHSAATYSGGIVEGVRTPPTAHAALLALYCGLVPPARIAAVRRFLLDNFEKEKPFPYTYRFVFDVLYQQNTEEADRLALDIMRRKWEPMTHNVTGAASENWGTYSFMHESGSHPAYFLSAYVLGVRGTRSRLTIEPRLAGLDRAEGVVLTEHGPVQVAWRRGGRALAFTVEVPVEAALSVRRTASRIELDGKPGRASRVLLPAGRHTGRIS